MKDVLNYLLVISIILFGLVGIIHGILDLLVPFGIVPPAIDIRDQLLIAGYVFLGLAVIVGVWIFWLDRKE